MTLPSGNGVKPHLERCKEGEGRGGERKERDGREKEKEAKICK